MENSLKLRVTKEVVEGILAKHTGKDFVQCLNCGSIISDAKELARTLYGISQETFDSEEEVLIEMGELCSELLRQIIVIGMPEECYGDSEFCTKWLNENDGRSLPELSGFEYEVYVEFLNVVLKVNDSCECFEKLL